MSFAAYRRSGLVPLVFFGLAGPITPTGRAEVLLPGKVVVKKVDFERHVMGLLGRMGCNAGSCHGSFRGKGGFRLSLFGYDPAKDYAAVTRDHLGRRVNTVEPDRSLCLLKATGRVNHGGGVRFGRGSWQYRLLHDWVAGGARWRKGSGAVAALTVTPAESALVKPGRTCRVRVTARFADGTREDVTALSELRVQDDAVAELSAPGVVKALRPGDTALVVSYRGNVRAIRVLVPRPAQPGFRYPRQSEGGYIDREVFAKLRRLNLVPSRPAGDAEFLRRITIDTIGCLPTPAEVRAFLADKSPAKRAKKIEELLANPLHAALWATKFSDITGNNTNAIRAQKGISQAKYSQMWHDWFRKRVAANTPYDEIVRGVLCATSREGRSAEEWLRQRQAIEGAAAKSFSTPYPERATLDLFWIIGKNQSLELMAERTAAAFMGIRLECAQCHKHPFNRWTQADYRAYANVFGQWQVGLSPEAFAILTKGQPLPKKGKKKFKLLVFELFRGRKVRRLADPAFTPEILGFNKKGKPIMKPLPPIAPRILGGPLVEMEPDNDARATLWEWLRSPDNPYFAHSFVNRLWAHYFGVGLVNPVDDFSLANPPTNARLLNALAKDFIKHRFDIRHLERTILNSRVYQLSSEPNETNRQDRINFSRSYLRPLLAEVVVDVLNSALDVRDYFGPEAPPNCRAIEIGSSRTNHYGLRVFGRPTRVTTCDCERDPEPALQQTLYLMTDPEVLQKLRLAALPAERLPPIKFKYLVPGQKKGKKYWVAIGMIERSEGRLARLFRSGKSDDEVLEELFLATLSRFPTAAEKKHFADYRAAWKPPRVPNRPGKRVIGGYLAKLSQREAIFVEVAWALINTREFILNH
jgi:hypothetical protein